LFGIIGILVLKILNKDIYRLLPPLILPNTGNMGMPICLFAYGKLGLAIAAAVTTVIVVFHFTLNIFLASRKFSLKPLINCISIYALIISLFFVYFKIPSPNSSLASLGNSDGKLSTAITAMPLLPKSISFIELTSTA